MPYEIFIIGGAPSLKEFDFSLLHGLETIGCNAAAEQSSSKYVCSMDRLWIRTNQDVLEKYSENAHIACCDKTPRPESANVYKKDHSSVLSLKANYLAGKHSGHAAMNLAFLMGADIIHLLGIELNVTGHWHGGYGNSSLQRLNIMRQWAQYTDRAINKIKGRGVNVINWSLTSGLKNAEKRGIDELPNYLRS